ncbi:hypothetical protein SGRIM128S_06363 [Streptomyces griseomycini]
MVATYRTLYAIAYAATAVTPSRATIATSARAPVCRTVKSADTGSPVARVRRSETVTGSPGSAPRAARSSPSRRSATSPAPRATSRHSIVETAAPRTPYRWISSGSHTRISPLASSASRIGVRVSPAPLRMPSTRVWAKKTAVPGRETAK